MIGEYLKLIFSTRSPVSFGGKQSSSSGGRGQTRFGVVPALEHERLPPSLGLLVFLVVVLVVQVGCALGDEAWLQTSWLVDKAEGFEWNPRRPSMSTTGPSGGGGGGGGSSTTSRTSRTSGSDRRTTAAAPDLLTRDAQPVWRQLVLQDGQVHPAIQKLKQDLRNTPSRPVFRLRWPDFSNPDLAHFRNLALYEQRHNSPKANKNLLFHKNKIPSRPLGAKIETIHKEWSRDFDKLEKHHGYIQWLFPIHEKGMTSESQPLQVHEREAIKNDQQTMQRFLASYKMMLRFYGFRLTDERTGEIAVLPKASKRHSNLNARSHNYLRITRILKSLGLFGLPHYQSGFMAGMLRAMLLHDLLGNARSSCGDYWVNAVLRDVDRRALQAIIVAWSGRPLSRTASNGLPWALGGSSTDEGDEDEDGDNDSEGQDSDQGHASDSNEGLAKYDMSALDKSNSKQGQQHSRRASANAFQDKAYRNDEADGQSKRDKKVQGKKGEQAQHVEQEKEEKNVQVKAQHAEQEKEEKSVQEKLEQGQGTEGCGQGDGAEHDTGLTASSTNSSSRSSGDNGSGSGSGGDGLGDDDGDKERDKLADGCVCGDDDKEEAEGREDADGNRHRADASPCSKQPKISQFLLTPDGHEPGPLEAAPPANAEPATAGDADRAASSSVRKDKSAGKDGDTASKQVVRL